MSTNAVLLKLALPCKESIDYIYKETDEQNLNIFVSQVYAKNLEFEGFPNAYFPMYSSWLDHLNTNLFYTSNLVDDFIRARVDPKFYWSIGGHEFIFADTLTTKSYSAIDIYDLYGEAKYDVNLISCDFFKYQEVIPLIRNNSNLFVEEMEKTFVEGEMYLSLF